MSEQEWVRVQFQRGLGDGERGAEGFPRTERVLPEDLDVDAELDRRFAEPGVGVRVAVI
jgi:hypothetical protein